MAPAAVPCGSIRSVYVPVTGRVVASMKPPLLLKTGVAETRGLPSGLSREA